MTYNQSTRAAVRHLPATVFALTVVLNVALIGVLIHQSPPSTWAAPDVAPPGPTAQPLRIESAPEGQLASAITIADGTVPDGATVFDDEIPAVANLDPNLLGALRNAAADAERDGVEFVVNSGWRSTQYQQQLLRDAVLQYGSEQEAARWVAPPEKSAHVSGEAVDIGPDDAAAWLSANGEKYGLCQTYGNEPWHFELRSNTYDFGCQAPYADPTQDPRMMQQ